MTVSTVLWRFEVAPIRLYQSDSSGENRAATAAGERDIRQRTTTGLAADEDLHSVAETASDCVVLWGRYEMPGLAAHFAAFPVHLAVLLVAVWIPIFLQPRGRAVHPRGVGSFSDSRADSCQGLCQKMASPVLASTTLAATTDHFSGRMSRNKTSETRWWVPARWRAACIRAQRLCPTGLQGASTHTRRHTRHLAAWPARARVLQTRECPGSRGPQRPPAETGPEAAAVAQQRLTTIRTAPHRPP